MMTKKYHLPSFIFRWLVGCLGLFVASGLLGDKLSVRGSVYTLLIAGLVLTVLNSVVKPILVFLTFPFMLLSLGLFVIVLNGVVVALASMLYPSLHIESFWAAMLAGMIIGLVNYIVAVLQPGGRA